MTGSYLCILRIQTRYCGTIGKLVGIFGACHHLKRREILSAEEVKLFEDIDKWFTDNLPEPPFYEDGNTIRAITWFKDTSTDMIGRLAPLMALLSKYDIDFDVVRTDSPGEIIYEDEYQVGVI